jgi:hypothetical protein
MPGDHRPKKNKDEQYGNAQESEKLSDGVVKNR